MLILECGHALAHLASEFAPIESLLQVAGRTQRFHSTNGIVGNSFAGRLIGSGCGWPFAQKFALVLYIHLKTSSPGRRRSGIAQAYVLFVAAGT